jgi:1-acyl-sn-glycerol-3-phosphate acyltransferase
LTPFFQAGFKWKFIRINFSARSKAVKGIYTTEEWVRSSYDVMRLLESCGGRFHVTGLKNIRECQGPAVFVGNHMSTLETMVLPFLISQVMDSTFVVKDSLVKSRAFGPIMRSRDPIVVSRHNSREDLVKVMTEGRKILSGGRSIVIFPQSTRTTTFKPEEFNSLGVKLAAKAGVPVIPFALKTDFWLNGKLVKDLGPLVARDRHVHFEFGPAMTISGSGREENQQIIGFIQDRLNRWMVQ